MIYAQNDIARCQYKSIVEGAAVESQSIVASKQMERDTSSYYGNKINKNRF